MIDRIALKNAACPAVSRPVQGQVIRRFATLASNVGFDLLGWHTSSTRPAKRHAMHLTHVFQVLLSFSPFDSQLGTLLGGGSGLSIFVR